MSNTKNNTDLVFWDLLILVLSVYVLIALLVISLVPVSNEIKSIISTIDSFICLIFIGDFVYRLVSAKRKFEYLKFGWIDLAASLPMVPFLRWGRALRIVRILRVLRGFKSVKHIMIFLFKKRSQSTFLSVLMATFILMLFAALSIANFETEIGGQQAFWWSLFTIITGEHWAYNPKSIEGKTISALLMVAGAALFSTLTAYIASYFLEGENEADEKRDNEILDEIREIKRQISVINDRIGNDSKHNTQKSSEE
jgi:voltage-gated potassium channel